MRIPFRDRRDAGRQLGARLGSYADRSDLLVLGLPRGGVPVAYEVAQALHAPLDVCVVRKLGVPGHEELAMGAITSGDVRVLDYALVAELRISDDQIRAVEEAERRELARREALYRDGRPPPDVAGRTVILIDDGLATGATMRAAAMAQRKQEPKWIVIAAPVAASSTCAGFRDVADETICLLTPRDFYAVGLWYGDFDATSDEEVCELLRQRRDELTERPASKASTA